MAGEEDEERAELWRQLVASCAAQSGREASNIKAYIGNAVLQRQLAALGDENVDKVIELASKTKISSKDRAHITKILQEARKHLESKDNGSKAAFSAGSFCPVSSIGCADPLR